MQCVLRMREVYDSAVQRVDELLKLRKGFDNNNSNNINNNNNINSLKWKTLHVLLYSYKLCLC